MSSNKKEYKGKDIDEAIAIACKDFDVSQNELDIEVLSTGSAGIFGLGRRKAVILVSRRPPVAAPPEVVPAPAKGKREQAQKPKEFARPESRGTERGGGGEKPFRPGGNGRKGAGQDLPGKAKEAKHGVSHKKERDRVAVVARREREEVALPPPSQAVLDEIKDLTQTMVRLMGFSAEVTVTVEGHKTVAHILGDFDHETIVGRDGSTLDALQYLLRKIVSQKFPEKVALALDAGTYRDDRQKELEQRALELAAKVKESGKSQTIGALNPAERRIVHVALQDDPEIRSASVGEGLFKKVRIYLPGKGRKKSYRGNAGEHPVEQDA